MMIWFNHHNNNNNPKPSVIPRELVGSSCDDSFNLDFL